LWKGNDRFPSEREYKKARMGEVRGYRKPVARFEKYVAAPRRRGAGGVTRKKSVFWLQRGRLKRTVKKEVEDGS